MPANVESMFSVRQMPWHREGTIVQDYPGSWAQARTLAGLDWDPVTAPVYAPVGINPDGTAHYEPIEGWKTITRSDTGVVLSISKDSYTVIDHAEMADSPDVRGQAAEALRCLYAAQTYLQSLTSYEPPF